MLAAAPYFLWVVVVHQRIGAWPWEAGDGIVGAPLDGLRAGISYWGLLERRWRDRRLTVGALVLGYRSVFAWIASAYAIYSMLFGGLVWKDWAGFSRVLLPLVAAAVVAIVVALPCRSATQMPRCRQ